MKNQLVLLALLSVAGTAQAQQRAYFGVKGGLSLTDLVGTAAAKGHGYQGGIQAGLLADVALSQHLAFHPELLLTQKGTHIYYQESRIRGNDAIIESASGEDRLNYLDLPLLLRLRVAGAFAELGPQASCLLGRRYATTTYTNTTSFSGTGTTNVRTDYLHETTQDVRRWDVGYVVGLGYQFWSGLELGLRYSRGLVGVPATGPAAYNSAFQLQVGYLLGKQ